MTPATTYGNAPSPTDNAPHILVVDDDQRIRDLLGRFLQENGFRVTTAENSAAARANMRGLAFDLLVLDVMMPGETGMELAESLRNDHDIPILMLTARAEPDQRIRGLEIGVDDYLAKPFEPRELLLRLQNILSRHKRTLTPQDVVRIGDFTFHIGRGELKSKGETIRLTERERDLLRQFAERPGTPISRLELAKQGADGSERAVDVQINRLRRKIEADPGNPVYLQTVRGKGYILHAE
ncbi:MAG: response regulator transcription factor [Hyphomicrobiaceae bacterium]|nr:response regulator transcription factor [Hyphomicrobiaceae bacterium]